MIAATPISCESLDAVETRRLFGPIAYVPRWLIQTNLPHSDPGPISSWTRVNGRSRLTVQPFIEEIAAGTAETPTLSRQTGFAPRRFRKLCESDGRTIEVIHHGIPYGPLPRLFLAYVGAEVVMKKSPVIDLGEDMTSFMRELGLVPKWGLNGTNARLRDQVHRCATCRIGVVERDGLYRNFSLADELAEFWLFDQTRERGVWSRTMTLTQKAFHDFLTNRVPCNMGTLFALKKSALALDIYNWLSLRLFQMNEPSRPISYVLLARQFGSEYSRHRDFRAYFNRELRRVLAEYRSARVEILKCGIRLYPSNPHVRELPAVQ